MSRERSRVLVVTLLVMSIGLGVAIILLAGQVEEARGALAEVERKAETCAAAPRSEPEDDPPPSISSHYLHEGVDIAPLLRLRIERVREGVVDEVRLGSPDVLAPGAIHIVTLWATWCSSCKELLPDLRLLFLRRGSDWSEVRFIPVQTSESVPPDLAIRDHAASMPPHLFALADRALEDRLTKGLESLPNPLYRGRLPVTLVLDCGLRVRWAKSGEMTPDDLDDLERWVDHFVDELRDRAPHCREPGRCGDARCDATELRACADDCEVPPLLSAPPPEVAPELFVARPPRLACPAGCETCDRQGRCRDLTTQASPEPPPLPSLKPMPSCGDRRCERPAEGPNTCCADCGCEAGFECKRDRGGEQRCVPPLSAEAPATKCGDGFCQKPQESSLNCCSDCGCEGALVCLRGREACVPRLR